ncbi:MAG TPA: ABC transporter substrate-binding protein [Chloroflexota bacterium]|nr:ABC transporter substrate-binding protein [Chloroflexota bacterium]
MLRHAGWLLFLVSVLGACSGPAGAPAAPAASSAQAPPPTRVRLIYTSQGATQLPIWLAQEEGYFQANGLEVELTFVSGSTTATQALLAREADVVAQGGGATVGAALGGADTVMVATTHGKFVFLLVARPDIADLGALKGHSLGVTRFGTTSDFATRFVLQRIGLEPGTDVPLIQTGGNAETAAALESGAIQAAMVTDVFGIELRRKGFRELLDLGDLDIEYSHNGLATTRTFIAEQPDTVRRVLRSVLQGMGRLVRDPEESKRVLSRYSQIDDPTTLEQSWQVHVTKYLRRVPYTTPAAIRLVLEELAPRYERARTANPEEFYDNRFVEELDRSGFIAQLYP